jgi:hypothetical protein
MCDVTQFRSLMWHTAVTGDVRNTCCLFTNNSEFFRGQYYNYHFNEKQVTFPSVEPRRFYFTITASAALFCLNLPLVLCQIAPYIFPYIKYNKQQM